MLYLVLSLSLIVATFHLSLFGFRMSNDGPFWISVSQVFRTGNITNFGCLHCLENPVLPAILAGLHFLGLDYLPSFAAVNTISFFLNQILFYKLTLILTKTKPIALLASILFMIDFENQYLTFSAMPDSLTWTFLLLLLSSMVSETYLGLTGLLSGIATLTKTNLLFFTLLFPILRKKVSVLFVLGAFLLPITYYILIFKLFSWLPWDSLVQNSKTLTRSPLTLVSSFASSYLYLWIFIILGLSKTVFKISVRNLIAMVLMTLVPIIIWPFYVPRFTFTTFWFFLPFAANGIIKLTKGRTSFIATFLTLLYLLNTLRIYLGLTGLTHLQIIQFLLAK